MNDLARAAVEERTRAWLDAAFLRGVAAIRDRVLVFDPAGRPQHMTPYDFQELQRKLNTPAQIQEAIDHLERDPHARVVVNLLAASRATRS